MSAADQNGRKWIGGLRQYRLSAASTTNPAARHRTFVLTPRPPAGERGA